MNGRINGNLYSSTDWFYQAMCLVDPPADPISLTIVRAPSEIIRANTLKLVYIALYGSGAPALGQSGVDGIPVATQVAAEAAQFGRTSLMHIGDPLLQLATAAFTYQTQEMLC